MLLVVLPVAPLRADADDFRLSVRNMTQSAPNRLEFDLYLLDTDNSQAFEFISLDLGLLLNSSLHANGSITVTYDNGSSGLGAEQQFVNAPEVRTGLPGHPGRTLILLRANLVPPFPPGVTSGTVIDATGAGVLLTHFIIESSEPFPANSRAGLAFCDGNAADPLYPTVIYAIIEDEVRVLPVSPGTDAVVEEDPLLTPTSPATFNVTGGGEYCHEDPGPAVGLDGSEQNTIYTLFRNNTEIIMTMPGTGSALNFGSQIQGAYTVTAENEAGPSVRMIGQAEIIELPDNAFTLTSGPGTDNQSVCLGTVLTTITYSTTGATGIGTPSGLPAGVSAVWSSGVITISGTPTVSGNFTYTIPLLGGCGTVNATGTITVRPENTVSAASSSPTLCINTPLTPITHATTGATAIGTPTGLPAGVTAAWLSGVITISGTPTAPGVFTYTIPLTGGCGTVSATGTITVAPENTVSAASSSPTLCINTPLTPITHTTTGATGIGTPTGLPAGVTAVWSSDVITISGTPTASGVFTYTIPLTGGCGNVSATGTIRVNPLPVTSAISGETRPACRGTGYVYSVTGTAGSTYQWSVPQEATIVSGQTTSSITVNFGSVNGNISVTETSAAGCTGTQVILAITLRGCDLAANFEGFPLDVCIGDVVTFRDISTGTSGNTEYQWDFGADADPATATGAGPHQVRYATAGGKTVSLTITEGASVRETKVDYIRVRPDNTVGAASSSPTLCFNTPLTPITHATTGATGIGTPTGLPAGVTATWSSDVITISGTPTVSGVFTYTIPLTGGCGTVNATGTITVRPENTVGAASSSPMLCINTPLTPITHTTTGATNIGTPSGLPNGVTAVWSSDVITISGTPTASGVFTYTIPLTGGCGTVSATGTIRVMASPGAAGQITGPLTYTPGTSAVPYSVSPIPAAASYVWSYSGSGVTINGNSNSVTLDFSASATPGTLSVFGRNDCGDGLPGSIQIVAATRTLTITSLLLEGLYAGNGEMRQAQNENGAQWPAGIADHIRIELHDANNYASLIWVSPEVELNTRGNARLEIPAVHGGNYYITVRHRNSLATVSARAESFSGDEINISFADPANVYGRNLLTSSDNHYLIYGGDANQDGAVDTNDYIPVVNDAARYARGYLHTDIDGNGRVDTADYTIMVNNTARYIRVIHP